MGHQSVLVLTTSIILFLSVDAALLKNLAEKIEKQVEKEESYKPEVSDPVLSHKFSDYETNDDGFIDYEEFAFHFMKKFKILNLEEMRKAYSEADKDGDGKLNEKEFAAFPLHDSATEGEKENRRGCGIRCGFRCFLIFCIWGCSAGCG